MRDKNSNLSRGGLVTLEFECELIIVVLEMGKKDEEGEGRLSYKDSEENETDLVPKSYVVKLPSLSLFLSLSFVIVRRFIHTRM